MTEGRQLPCNPEVERAVLGSVMLYNDAYYSTDDLSIDLFALDSHRRIFGKMTEMLEESHAVDLNTLIAKLGDSKELTAVGGAAYVCSLTDGLSQRTDLKHYTRILKEKQLLRSLYHTLDANLQRITDGDYKASDIAGSVQEDLFALQANSIKQEAVKFDRVMVETTNELLTLKSHDGELVGLSTGIDDLDLATTGLRPAEMWVVGAYPGRGKTILGTQIAITTAKRLIPVLFFSLEMTRTQLGVRSLATCGEVSAAQLRNPKYMNESEWRAVGSSADQLAELPLYVDDSGSMSARELVARAKLYIRRYGVRLIVVDYLQLVEGPGKELREKVGRVANSLRQIAKDERISVVAISQLSRPKSGNLNETPNMSQLRESGEIEAHAHTILLLSTPEDDDGRPTGEDSVVIAKQRNGPKGPINVVLDGRTMTFKQRVK